MKTVSVIGLGAMGAVLARTLLDAGYRVTVWNRDSAKMHPLIEAGATGAADAAAAIRASEATITCIRSHGDTLDLLRAVPEAVEGATIIELSTGGAPEAEALAAGVTGMGGACLLGMIATFPGDIGKPDSTIVTVGDAAVWDRAEAMLKALAGASVYVGDRPASLAVLYAALVLPRQGFMFGMLYGAALCQKAGLPVADYVRQLPLTLKVTHDYCDVFAATVPEGRFDDPPAALGMYAAALEDVLATFGEMGTRDELPRLLNDLMQEGMAEGLGEKHLTALVRILAR